MKDAAAAAPAAAPPMNPSTVPVVVVIPSEHSGRRRMRAGGGTSVRSSGPRVGKAPPGKVRKLKEPNDIDQSSGHASENEFDVRKARS